MATVTENLNAILEDKRAGRDAVTYRGGTVSDTAGFAEIAEEVIALPPNVSTGTVVDNSVAKIKAVPADSVSKCYISELGGMTYKSDNELVDTKIVEIRSYSRSKNLFEAKHSYFGEGAKPGDTKTKYGVTFTYGEDGSYILNGTPTSNGTYSLGDFRVGSIGGKSATIVVFFENTEMYSSAWDFYNKKINLYCKREAMMSEIYLNLVSGSNVYWKTFADENYGYTYYIRTPTGMTLTNVKIKIMVVEGFLTSSEVAALTYEPYKPPKIYPIPQALIDAQTGKGVAGYCDAVDLETNTFVTRTRTIRLGDVYGYQSRTFSGSNMTADGVGSVYSYIVNDFVPIDDPPRICSHLPNSTVWIGSEVGVGLIPMSSGDHYVFASILAEWAGATTESGASNVWVPEWLKDNDVVLTYALASPIRDILPAHTFNPVIDVEPGGYLEFITDTGEPAHSVVTFQTVMN